MLLEKAAALAQEVLDGGVPCPAAAGDGNEGRVIEDLDDVLETRLYGALEVSGCVQALEMSRSCSSEHSIFAPRSPSSGLL